MNLQGGFEISEQNSRTYINQWQISRGLRGLLSARHSMHDLREYDIGHCGIPSSPARIS